MIANIGVPMLFVALPLGILAFPIIVAVEWLIGWKRFDLPPRPCLKATLLANVVSTLVGIPVTWLCLVLLMAAIGTAGFGNRIGDLGVFGNVLISAPWLMPERDYGSIGWKVQLALLALLVPFFFASVWVERKVCLTALKPYDGQQISRWVWIANFVSYAGAAVVTLTLLLRNLSRS